ncbi:hypothetical protein PZB74_09295 [Porifericola rhodea]|uniref:hypothetical protein n=1 Tax=Porifericola rhodea TaxID=930972 RepID=UPI002666AE15|nr:hypothetical protein [Porifericola rhodea]WKN33524.1 hypothetical protein PZB74_09295 [Porifericola rhodea]
MLWNDEGSFRLQALPLEAWTSPVYAILCDHINEDGMMNIWLGGNFYTLKPQVER